MIDPITQIILEKQETKPVSEVIIIPFKIPGDVSPAVGKAASVAFILMAAGAVAIKIWEKYRDKKFPHCKRLESEYDQEICFDKEKIKMYKEQIIATQKLKSQCGKTTDPKKCSIKLSEKLLKIKKKILRTEKSIKSHLRYKKGEQG